MAVSHGFNLTEATTSVSAPVQVSSGLQIIVGTAPVNQLANPAAAVNTPLYVSTYKEAVAAVGWSSDFAKYTLCEAISANFKVVGTAPIVVINVLDPANRKHITALDETSVQVNDGVAEIDKVGILLEKLVVKKDTTTLTADVDYIASFNDDGTVSLALITGGAGDDATTLTVSGSILDASKVTADDIVGGVNAATGAETGLEVVRQAYPKLSKAPGILLAPRFSKNAQVCAALQAKCRKINGLFNAVCFVDLDCSADGAQKYTDVAKQKAKQTATSREAYALWLYVKVGETVYSGSSMAAAATVYNDSQNGDRPVASPSNVTVPISAACLEDGTEVLMNQEQGTFLNDQGIATFIRSGNDFVIWGNETAAYPKNTDPKDMFLCIRRFFNYAWTSFVLDNMSKLDKPMNPKRLQSIIDSENMKGSKYG
jgi:phage tail sheath protein FI